MGRGGDIQWQLINLQNEIDREAKYYSALLNLIPDDLNAESFADFLYDVRRRLERLSRKLTIIRHSENFGSEDRRGKGNGSK